MSDTIKRSISEDELYPYFYLTGELYTDERTAVAFTPEELAYVEKAEKEFNEYQKFLEDKLTV